MSAGVLWRARCRTSPRWARAGRGVHRARRLATASARSEALELMRGALRARRRRGDRARRRRRGTGTGPDGMRDRRRLGGSGERTRRARRCAGRGSRRGDREARRQTQPSGPAPGRGQGARARRRPRDDRPLRRARHRRAAHRRSAAVCAWRSSWRSCRSTRACPAGEQAATAGEDYELCFTASPRHASWCGGCPARRGRRDAHLDRAGPRSAPGVSFLDDEGNEHQLEGFEHRW